MNSSDDHHHVHTPSLREGRSDHLRRQALNELGKNPFTAPHVVIDCGHTRVWIEGDQPQFQLSATQELTARIGISLARNLRDSGKNYTMSLCLSDMGLAAEERRVVKSELGNMRDRVLRTLDATDVQSVVTLQSQNSNWVSNQLHRHRRRINGFTPEQMFEAYGALFFDYGNRFGYYHSLPLGAGPEIQALGGDWWLAEEYTLQPADLFRAPLAAIKKSPPVILRAESITCPATYAGLALRVRQEAADTQPIDHVAIYARADDPDVGEKVIRGGLSAFVLDRTWAHSFRSLTLQDRTGLWEATYLLQESVQAKSDDYDHLQQALATRLHVTCSC